MTPTMYVLDDGTRMAVMDKTRPIAQHDFECRWSGDNPHTIKQGDRYVRVVYKIEDGELRSDQVCLTCWCGVFETEAQP